jgi:hypothetical protein
MLYRCFPTNAKVADLEQRHVLPVVPFKTSHFAQAPRTQACGTYREEGSLRLRMASPAALPRVGSSEHALIPWFNNFGEDPPNDLWLSAHILSHISSLTNSRSTSLASGLSDCMANSVSQSTLPIASRTLPCLRHHVHSLAVQLSSLSWKTV